MGSVAFEEMERARTQLLIRGSSYGEYGTATLGGICALLMDTDQGTLRKLFKSRDVLQEFVKDLVILNGKHPNQDTMFLRVANTLSSLVKEW